jgi:2-phospho-L-lactate guanylyltransferase
VVAPTSTSVVIIPIKSFTGAKERLAGVLTAQERDKLARFMAIRVLRAAAPMPVLVVCDDDDVTAWALLNGAAVVRQDKPGLNNAVQSGFAAARDAGYKWAVIAHSDLPLANRLDHLLDHLHDGLPRTGPSSDRAAVIVGDQLKDGTNVLVLATSCNFEFHYGPSSFAAHCSEAAHQGLDLRIVADTALATDIDTPSDLAHLPSNWRD